MPPEVQHAKIHDEADCGWLGALSRTTAVAQIAGRCAAHRVETCKRRAKCPIAVLSEPAVGNVSLHTLLDRAQWVRRGSVVHGLALMRAGGLQTRRLPPRRLARQSAPGRLWTPMALTTGET